MSGIGDTDPVVAVVIPTRNRESRLAFALEALSNQTLDPAKFEVVVVRAPGEPSPRAQAPTAIQTREIDSEVAGPAAQRNLGWRSSDAKLIAFTDDDCRPSDRWLEQLLAAHTAEPEAMLQGRTEPDPDELHLYWGFARSWRITEENGWFATCNMAYPRQLLERSNGFDEHFGAAWGEDTDLGLRLRELGAEQRYVEEALTWHAVLPRSLAAALREAGRRGETAKVIARHPSHREELYLGYFAHARHARLAMALVGSSLAQLSPALAAIAWVPYLNRNIDRAHLGVRGVVRQILHLPARLAVDLVEMVVVARAGIRARVPLL